MTGRDHPGRWTDSGVAVVGGAGFIGSHFVDSLLASPEVQRVTVFDNLSNGHEEYLAAHRRDSRLRMIRADAADLKALCDCFRGRGVVIRLASYPDIAEAIEGPTIYLWSGSFLTAIV